MKIFSVLLITSVVVFCSWSSFRVLPTKLNEDFIQFPATKLTPKHKYQYVLFYDLSGNYQTCTYNLDNALIWHGDVDYFSVSNQSSLLNKLEKGEVSKSLSSLAAVQKSSFTSGI